MQIPAYAWLISALLGIGLSWWAYRFLFFKHIAWKIAAVLRAFALFLVILWLFDPQIQFSTHETKAPQWDVYIDVSKSTQTDQAALMVYLDSLKRTNPKVQFRMFAFAENLLPYANAQLLGGNTTRLEPVFAHMQANKSQTKLRIICSDGIVNQGRMPEFFDYSELGPIATLGLGDTSSYTDLRVKDLLSNPEVYQGNSTEIEANLEAVSVKGKSLKIVLMVNGEKVQEDIWIPESERAQKRWSYTLSASRNKGNYIKVDFKLEPLQGERNIQNNSKSVVIKVLDSRKNIDIVYGGPHPDIKALQLALLDKEAYSLRTYPESQSLKTDADAYVLHGITRSEIRDAVYKSKKPIWWFAFNTLAFSSLGSAAESALIRKGLNGFQESNPLINEQFQSFELPQQIEIAAIWNRLETPLMTLKVPAEQVQMYQIWNGEKTEVPLMLSRQKERPEHVFLGAGVWRWRMNESKKDGLAPLFDAWVGRNVQWLLRSSTVRKGWNFIAPEGNLVLGEKQKVKWIYYDESGEKQIPKGMEAILTDKNGKKTPLPLYIENQEFVSYVQASQSGIVSVHVEGENGIPQGTGVLQVEAQYLEDLQNQAEHDFLAKIAKKSGACFGDFRGKRRDWISQVNALNLDVGNIQTINRFLPFERIGLFLLLLIGLLSGEWFIRKWMGKI